MCDTCGCGDSELVPVEVQERILSGNERTARHNREHFEEAGVFAINLMGSPGSGKTAVLEATARARISTRSTASVSGRARPASRFASVAPRRSGIVKKLTSSTMPTSYTGTMFG